MEADRIVEASTDLAKIIQHYHELSEGGYLPAIDTMLPPPKQLQQ